jgi:hypothetical protein
MGASYTVGTCTLKMPKNKIAVGEILRGNLILNLKPGAKISQVSSSIIGHELAKHITTTSKGHKDTHILYEDTVSHEIFKRFPSSLSHGAINNDFSFKIPNKLPASVQSSGHDFELRHHYTIETLINSGWGSYICKHEINIKSISFQKTDDDYVAPDLEISPTTSPKFKAEPTYSMHKPGFMSVSPVGIGNRYIDVSAFYNFTGDKDKKYKVRFRLVGEHVYKLSFGFTKKFSDVIGEYECIIAPESQKMIFENSMLVKPDVSASYLGKNASLTYKVFFTIDDPTKYLLKKVFEDSREINIKSSYDSSEEYNQQAKLINTKLANFPKQFKEFTDSIFAILFLIFVSGCLLILQHREELERALKEKDGDILKLLEDRDTLIKIFKSSPSKESPKDSADK